MRTTRSLCNYDVLTDRNEILDFGGPEHMIYGSSITIAQDLEAHIEWMIYKGVEIC